MTKTASKLTDVLNGPIATALTRFIVITGPFVLATLLYAGQSWLNEKIATSPAVTELVLVDAKIQQEVATHQVRFNEIETTAKLAASTSTEVTRKLDETQRDVKDISRQLSRLVGSFEARGLIPRQPQPLSDP
jgi:hypothetical protein